MEAGRERVPFGVWQDFRKMGAGTRVQSRGDYARFSERSGRKSSENRSKIDPKSIKSRPKDDLGASRGHLGPKSYFFIDFGWILGAIWDPKIENKC